MTAAVEAAAPTDHRRAALGWWDVTTGAVVALAFSRASEALEASSGLPPLSTVVAIGAAGWLLLDRRERQHRRAMLPAAVAVISVDLAVVTWSALGAADPGRSLESIDGRVRGIAIAIAVVLLVRTPTRLRAALVGIAGATALVAAVNLFQAATGRYGSTYGGLARAALATLGTGSGYRLGGPVGDPNFFAQMLAPGTVVALVLALRARAGWARSLFLATAAGAAVALVLTYSRGGLLALGLGAAVVAIRSLRVPVLVLLAAAAAVVALLAPPVLSERVHDALDTAPQALGGRRVSDSAINGRASEALVGLELFKDHPITGVGVGNYEVHYLERARSLGLDVRGVPRSAHSLVIETLAEVGLLGLATLSAVIGTAFLAIRSLRRTSVGADPDLWWWSVAVEAALVAHLATAALLHSAYPRGLWLLLGIALACGQVRSPRPDGAGGP